MAFRDVITMGAAISFQVDTFEGCWCDCQFICYNYKTLLCYGLWKEKKLVMIGEHFTL